MSKYKSKQQILDEITKEKSILDTSILNLDEAQLTKPGVCGDWSIKDIFFHLAQWQNMVLSWYNEGCKGNNPDVPEKGYKWSQLPELNKSIYEKFKDMTWEKSQELFKESEGKIMKLINKSSEDTLLKPGLYPWMNKNTLIAYLGSCTSSHYKWASGLIKKFTKNQK